jgi:hypothetical protein
MGSSQLSLTRRRNPNKLRVTSATPGTEIEFEGAYMFNGTDPAIHYVKQQTPFKITADGELAMGMFRSIAGTGQIKVEIDSFVGDEEGPAASASNDGVVFGDNLAGCGSPFIHAFKSSTMKE